MTTNDFRSRKPACLAPRAAYPAVSRHIPEAYQEQLLPVVSLKAPDCLPSPEAHTNPDGHQLGATPIDRIKRLPLAHLTGKFSDYFRVLACQFIVFIGVFRDFEQMIGDGRTAMYLQHPC